ncbi:MAG: RNA polymerase sigma factor [Chitinophagaceae bacterium]|jgi:RNA polymerase sigma factor (sigma-70 family)
MTEEVLLQGCLNNDANAQHELYQRYSPKMLSVCYRYSKSREDAEDMLQEGFIKVFTQIGKFEHRGSLEGWILRIIVHTCINHLKRNRKFNEHVDLAYAGDLMIREDNIPAILQAKQIVECIRMLPVGYRTVLNLYAIEGYSHKEIAHMLEIEESTSRSQYTRAKGMLEEILTKRNILQPSKEKVKWISGANAV